MEHPNTTAMTAEEMRHNLNNELQRIEDDQKWEQYLEELRLKEIKYRLDHPNDPEWRKKLAGQGFVNKPVRIYLTYID